MIRWLYFIYKMNSTPITKKLDMFLKTNRIPNTIFYGSSLSEKDTVLMNFLKEIYVTEKCVRENVMFVNCAHGKGIKFIRDEIKFFAKTISQPGISFKSIVLLNAEHLTIDAQSALRRCIEQFSNNTRFFIVIEKKNNLLNPILSRFCEIYVPETPLEKSTRNIEINRHLEMYACNKEKSTYADMISTVAELYGLAFCCKDIVNWIQSRNEWSELEKAHIGMCFSKIKSEYRCEKLLMLLILSISCFDPSIDLKKMSFM